MREGLFVVLEGIDGAGTTTQVARLVASLRARGIGALGTREPSDGPIGTQIRQILTGRLVVRSPAGGHAPPGWPTLALLFAADRVDHLESEIVPNLRDGVIVVSDRYDHSSVAYQGAATDDPAGAARKAAHQTGRAITWPFRKLAEHNKARKEAAEVPISTVSAGATLVATRAVNFRATASTSGRIITTIPDGGRVTAVGGSSVSGFYKVTYDGQTGYAWGAYLERENAGSGSTTRTVTLLWQGNWSFLTQCDRWSQGRVTFACQDFRNMPRDFVDNDYWLAAPGSLQGSSNRLCGRRVQVCKGTTCRTATVVERSVEDTSTTWEGSTRLIEDLGGDSGFSSCTRSWGTVTGVTLRY